MSKVLTTEQREQAGSDSYNRFEYQVHWIVCHIIGKLQEDAECIIFCEFHDDMAEFSPNNQQYQFFQIKTKEDSSDWTIAEMSKKEKKKAGGYKKSFVSRISSTLTQIENVESVEDVTTDIESLLSKAEEMRKMQFSYSAEMTVLENDIYVNQHKLHIVEHNLTETKKDIEFAMTQEDELVCPICGTTYSNGLEEQLNITSDYAHCEKLIVELKNSISIATEELERLKEKYNGVSLEIQGILCK